MASPMDNIVQIPDKCVTLFSLWTTADKHPV